MSIKNSASSKIKNTFSTIGHIFGTVIVTLMITYGIFIIVNGGHPMTKVKTWEETAETTQNPNNNFFEKETSNGETVNCLQNPDGSEVCNNNAWSANW